MRWLCAVLVPWLVGCGLFVLLKCGDLIPLLRPIPVPISIPMPLPSVLLSRPLYHISLVRHQTLKVLGIRIR